MGQHWLVSAFRVEQADQSGQGVYCAEQYDRQPSKFGAEANYEP